MNNLEFIEYIDKYKSEVISLYKLKYKNQSLRESNFWIIVKNLFQVILDIHNKHNIYIKKRYRSRIVISVLNNMVSDSYIESVINWKEFNNINNMIDNLDPDDFNDIQSQLFNKKICYCFSCY